ncbi:MAG: ATP-binding protein, partial [Chloroflexaceae bacterium]|nr:ATP-binding protein [Chloroflexaceae bacterium]
MSANTVSSWVEQNQRYLAAALERVRLALLGQAARASGAPAPALPPLPELELEPPPALVTLCQRFGLSAFERDLLVLCAGVELDGTLAAACAEAHGDPARPFPTFSLALAALPEAHWDAITPTGALRHWRLIELGPSTTLTRSPLRASEQVVHYLVGVHALDERLLRLVEPVAPPEALLPSHQAQAEQVVKWWTAAKGGPVPVVQLTGEGRDSKQALAAAACARLGLSLHALDAQRLPTTPADLDVVLGLWERDATLHMSALLLDCEALEAADGEQQRAAASLMARLRGALLVASREPQPLRGRPSVTLDVQRPQTDEQQTLWQQALGPLASQLNGQFARLVAQFNLDANTIRVAASEARQQATPTADMGRVVWEACRVQARTRLNDLAQRIVPAAGWDDLVLPEAQRATLHQIAAQVRQRARVYDDWGFATRGTRGLGMSALFAGASGTGKTTAAEVLAHELHLDLYRIDLSAVVSKYIGETEKNLRRVFDAAEESGAILLFDEADALFGKRSEVKDSHDRYANIEVSYLLQRMEGYRGLA